MPGLVFIHGGYVLGVVRKVHPLATSRSNLGGRLSDQLVVPGSLRVDLQLVANDLDG